MSARWNYNPITKSTDDGHDIVARTELEEAAERLWAAGVRSRSLIVDTLTALSGLSRGEVAFSIDTHFQGMIPCPSKTLL